MISDTHLPIPLSSYIVVKPGQVSTNLEGEIVILDAKSGQYYGLDEVGATVWQLIQEPKTIQQVRDAILAEYEVEAEQCEQDLLELLHTMAEKGLIELKQNDVTR